MRVATLALLAAQGVYAAAPAASPAAAGGAHSAAPAAAGASSKGASSHASGPDPDDVTNWYIIKCLLWAWLAVAGSTIAYTMYMHSVRYIRTVACLNDHNQKFFARPVGWQGALKKHIFDAPLFRTRHHREFRLSSAINNVGTLPSRLETIWILSYVAVSVALTVMNIKWGLGTVKVCEQVIKRTGFMAIMNMIPLFLIAGRNNPLIGLTGISFDTYNLIHRWLGRIVAVEAIVHGAAWMIEKVYKGGWAAVAKSEKTSSFILSGTIAACAFTAILFQSPSAIRHAFYEVFLHFHQALAALAIGGLWVHLEKFQHQREIIMGVLAIWCAERVIRLVRLIYRNVSGSPTKAEVELLPGDAVRLTLHMPRPWRFAPGQHAYLYIPSIGWWSSHPFTVAWSEDSVSDVEIEKGLSVSTVSRLDVLAPRKATISFIIRRRTGFTEKLYSRAVREPGGRFVTSAFAEGPYGDGHLMHSYGTCILFAAGVGITHQVPHVRDLVIGYNNGTVAARRVTLIWIIQAPEHLEWIRPWMTEILALPRRRELLKILLFVTRPRSTKEIHSPSSSVQMFPGKPNVQSVIDQEVEGSTGAVGVTVCGVGGLADEVRKGCRAWMGKVNIEFVEESFSW
ncbi:hypothetical protein EJ06DRAFT_287357 [Trichodelitschia bisporula]|uniref:ferric-chelate reductase (NADPH) n=1 Tax=Trichodelitschia bisporula TaxID=703511 RepID=A0A6G1I5W0_9PEZI|nr:hypothetical protein EJ06DRAFT_287357 [Trichodelitschia bisporula]